MVIVKVIIIIIIIKTKKSKEFLMCFVNCTDTIDTVLIDKLFYFIITFVFLNFILF